MARIVIIKGLIDIYRYDYSIKTIYINKFIKKKIFINLEFYKNLINCILIPEINPYYNKIYKTNIENYSFVIKEIFFYFLNCLAIL